MRRLSSLTTDELELVELVSQATHIAGWKLVGRIVEDSLGILSGDEERRLEEWVANRLSHLNARRVFNKIMRGEPGLHIAQVKRKARSTHSRGADLPPAAEPDADHVGGTDGGGPDDQSEQGGNANGH